MAIDTTSTTADELQGNKFARVTREIREKRKRKYGRVKSGTSGMTESMVIDCGNA